MLVVLQESLRVAVSLNDKALGVAAVEIPFVFQSPTIFSTGYFHGLCGKAFELFELSFVDFKPNNALNFTRFFHMFILTNLL